MYLETTKIRNANGREFKIEKYIHNGKDLVLFCSNCNDQIHCNGRLGEVENGVEMGKCSCFSLEKEEGNE